jgi:hypothetical protein
VAQNYRFVCLVAVTTTFAPTPREGGAAVEATSLYRFFRPGDAQTLALQGVSISVSAGEFVVVSGPSGSGKCLAGIDNPDVGIVAEPSCWVNCVHRWPVCTTPADSAATSTAARSALCTPSWGASGPYVCDNRSVLCGLQSRNPDIRAAIRPTGSASPSAPVARSATAAVSPPIPPPTITARGLTA